MHIKYRLFFFFLYFVSTSYIFEHTFYVLNRIIKIQNAFDSVPNPEQNRSNVRFDQSISINPRSRPSRAHSSREEKTGARQIGGGSFLKWLTSFAQLGQQHGNRVDANRSRGGACVTRRKLPEATPQWLIHRCSFPGRWHDYVEIRSDDVIVSWFARQDATRYNYFFFIRAVNGSGVTSFARSTDDDFCSGRNPRRCNQPPSLSLSLSLLRFFQANQARGEEVRAQSWMESKVPFDLIFRTIRCARVEEGGMDNNWKRRYAVK